MENTRVTLEICFPAFWRLAFLDQLSIQLREQWFTAWLSWLDIARVGLVRRLRARYIPSLVWFLSVFLDDLCQYNLFENSAPSVHISLLHESGTLRSLLS
jgi:hypothetical protein